jgi:hypothetical protein
MIFATQTGGWSMSDAMKQVLTEEELELFNCSRAKCNIIFSEIDPKLDNHSWRKNAEITHSLLAIITRLSGELAETKKYSERLDHAVSSINDCLQQLSDSDRKYSKEELLMRIDNALVKGLSGSVDQQDVL